MTQSSLDASSIQKQNCQVGLGDVLEVEEVVRPQLGLGDMLEVKEVMRSPELYTGKHLVRLNSLRPPERRYEQSLDLNLTSWGTGQMSRNKLLEAVKDKCGSLALINHTTIGASSSLTPIVLFPISSCSLTPIVSISISQGAAEPSISTTDSQVENSIGKMRISKKALVPTISLIRGTKLRKLNKKLTLIAAFG